MHNIPLSFTLFFGLYYQLIITLLPQRKRDTILAKEKANSLFKPRCKFAYGTAYKLFHIDIKTKNYNFKKHLFACTNPNPSPSYIFHLLRPMFASLSCVFNSTRIKVQLLLLQKSSVLPLSYRKGILPSLQKACSSSTLALALVKIHSLCLQMLPIVLAQLAQATCTLMLR